MLGHFNFKRMGDSVLITNDYGKYLFLSQEDFKHFLCGDLDQQSDTYKSLKNNYFFIESRSDLLSEDRITALRDMKNYLFSSTSLHIFAVTNSCNLSCIYCQAKDKASALGGFMTAETGRKAIDLALQSPSDNMTFEFQGGEPLLNFNVIKEMILYSEIKKGDKQIQYTMVSNLLALSDDKLQFLREHKVQVSTSLDGPRHVQEYNRRMRISGSSFDVVRQGYKRLQENGIDAGAIETTTRYSLNYPEDIINTYLDLGIRGVFLRPLTPLGFAKADWSDIGYTPEEFLLFYKRAFQRILEINRDGTCFPEYLAAYFLKKILQGFSMNYMELRSPCGAVTGQLSYYYDGGVYTCDEARMVSEMGDDAFCLGTVDNSYAEIVNTPICKAVQASSILESLPSCGDCVYQPYCGVCPVVTYAAEKDLFPRVPKNFRCQIYRGIQDYLFDLLKRNEPETMDILNSWVCE